MIDPLTLLQTLTSRVSNNLSATASRLSLQDYVRLTVIICGYCLLRPYLLKLSARFQTRDHERELDPNEMSSAAAVSPNSLRSQVTIPDDSDSEDEEGQGTGADWGKGARRRQRLMLRKLLDEEEKRKREEEEGEEDKDIEEFLVQ